MKTELTFTWGIYTETVCLWRFLENRCSQMPRNTNSVMHIKSDWTDNSAHSQPAIYLQSSGVSLRYNEGFSAKSKCCLTTWSSDGKAIKTISLTGHNVVVFSICHIGPVLASQLSSSALFLWPTWLVETFETKQNLNTSPPGNWRLIVIFIWFQMFYKPNLSCNKFAKWCLQMSLSKINHANAQYI